MKKKISVLSIIISTIAGALASGTYFMSKVKKKDEKISKFKNYYNMLNQWLSIKQKDQSLEVYFKDNGYKTIAIYGLGEMGYRLYDELKNSSIQILYAIDQKAEDIYSEIDIVGKEDDFKSVDVIVVSATFAYEEIKKELEQKTDITIISLEDVIFSI